MSYLFDGNDQFYTSTLPFTAMPSNDGMTLVIWVKNMTALAASNTFFDFGNTLSVNNFYRLNGNASQQVVAVNDKSATSDSNALTTGPTISTGTWQMLAAVFTDDDNTGLGNGTSTSRRAYLDGTLDSNDTTTTSTVWTDIASNGQITLGGTANFSNDFADGYLAHAQIYNKALSEAELDTLYGGTNPVAAATEANLVAYWPLVSDYVAVRGGTLSLNNAPVLSASDNPPVDPATIKKPKLLLLGAG